MNTEDKNNPAGAGDPGPLAQGKPAPLYPRPRLPNSTGLLVGNSRERSVPFRGRLTSATAGCCIARMLVLAAEDPRQPIIAYVASTGGLTSEALAAISTMDGTRCHIVTFCPGVLVGPAVVIAAHGLRGFRAATPNARFSFKGFDLAGPGPNVSQPEKSLSLWAEIVASDSRKALGEVLQWLKDGVRFTAQEALRNGLIDRISTEPVLPRPFHFRNLA